MDAIGWFIATLHQMLGHEKAAAVIGQPPGNPDECLLCKYEQQPDDELKQVIIDRIGGE